MTNIKTKRAHGHTFGKVILNKRYLRINVRKYNSHLPYMKTTTLLYKKQKSPKTVAMVTAVKKF